MSGDKEGIDECGLENFAKLGKQPVSEDYPEGYPGGYAFKTFEDVQRQIDEAYKDRWFAVFGLLADWENNTESNGNYWNNILFSRSIVWVDDRGCEIN